MPPADFWRQTPRLLDLIVDGRVNALKREHNERMSLAWHVAALTRAKKLPKLEKLMLRTRKITRQTWQEQLAIMDRWAAVMNKPEPKAKEK